MTKRVQIIGVPTDYGQKRRGVDMGPSAVRYAGLHKQLQQLGWEVWDRGNVVVNTPEQVPPKQRLATVAQICQTVYKIGRESMQTGDFTLFLGGDHSISIGSVAAMSQDTPIGLIWLDAHGDFNTPESSPSGNIHGMPVAVLVGEGEEALVNIGYAGAKVLPQNVVMIGIRDLDKKERERLRESGIHVYTMREIDEVGIGRIAHQTLATLQHLQHIHISFDVDSLDPRTAPGVGTPVPGGLTYRETHLLMEILGESGLIRSMDVVEVNPILDKGNQTAEVAAEMIASLLGKKIL